ncbi:MAG TPA: hypothetical protein VMU94_24285, partial [Streptosporangiaceae bacterium]|nr:hypothetical protein [Streptosporangiaceae bacterium]
SLVVLTGATRRTAQTGQDRHAQTARHPADPRTSPGVTGNGNASPPARPRQLRTASILAAGAFSAPPGSAHHATKQKLAAT